MLLPGKQKGTKAGSCDDIVLLIQALPLHKSENFPSATAFLQQYSKHGLQPSLTKMTQSISQSKFHVLRFEQPSFSFTPFINRRPYRVESTRSLPTSEAQQPTAWLVLWWDRLGRPISVFRITTWIAQKTWYTSRFVRVILAQGPCYSSLRRSNFIGCSPKGIHTDRLRHSAVISQTERANPCL